MHLGGHPSCLYLHALVSCFGMHPFFLRILVVVSFLYHLMCAHLFASVCIGKTSSDGSAKEGEVLYHLVVRNAFAC